MPFKEDLLVSEYTVVHRGSNCICNPELTQVGGHIHPIHYIILFLDDTS